MPSLFQKLRRNAKRSDKTGPRKNKDGAFVNSSGSTTDTTATVGSVHVNVAQHVQIRQQQQQQKRQQHKQQPQVIDECDTTTSVQSHTPEQSPPRRKSVAPESTAATRLPSTSTSTSASTSARNHRTDNMTVASAQQSVVGRHARNSTNASTTNRTSSSIPSMSLRLTALEKQTKHLQQRQEQHHQHQREHHVSSSATSTSKLNTNSTAPFSNKSARRFLFRSSKTSSGDSNSKHKHTQSNKDSHRIPLGPDKESTSISTPIPSESSDFMSATVVPNNDGEFVSSATMKRMQRLDAQQKANSSKHISRTLMSFRKSKKLSVQTNDDDDQPDTDLLCRTVRATPTTSTKSGDEDGDASIAASSQAKNMTSTQRRAQRRETERIARAAAALDNKGNLLFEKGYYDKAMETYTKALRLKRRTFHTLLDEADDILDEALEGEKLSRNPEKADAKLLVSMATSINNIGYLRQRSGEATPDETMAAYRKSLRIKREILGKDSLSVGKTLNNIGSVHYLKQEFHYALAAYSEALHIMRSNLGDTDPDVATVWSNMGDVYWAMSRAKEKALDHYRNALNIRWENFGEHDPRVVRLLEKIAAIEIGDEMLKQSENLRGGGGKHDYYYDNDDLLDLDTRPVVQELHMLHSEVEQDMQYVDLMQKRMAVDMVKDKVNILRGMRELEQNAKRQMELLTEQQKIKSKAAAEAKANGNGSSSNTNTNGVDANNDNHNSSTSRLSSSSSQSPRPSNGASRDKALQSIKDRLARLREQRAGNGNSVNDFGKASGKLHTKSDNGGGDENDANINNANEAEAVALCGAALYKAQFQRPTLSSFEAGELKQELDSIRSALILKKGIASLRSFNVTS